MDAHEARNTTATVAFVKANRAFRPGWRGLHRRFFQRFFQTGMVACGCMLLAGLVSAQDADVSEADTMNAYVEPFSEAPAELDMIPVPAGSVSLHGEDVAVGPFWMSETEVPWDIFDIYAFGTDEDAGDAGSEDALSAPKQAVRRAGQRLRAPRLRRHQHDVPCGGIVCAVAFRAHRQDVSPAGRRRNGNTPAWRMRPPYPPPSLTNTPGAGTMRSTPRRLWAASLRMLSASTI